MDKNVLLQIVEALAEMEPLSLRYSYLSSPYGSTGISYTPVSTWHCWFCGMSADAPIDPWGHVQYTENFQHHENCLWQLAKRTKED